MIMTLRSTRMTLRSTRMSTTGTVRRPYALPGSIAMQRLVSSELKVYTISDTGRLSASLSLGSASTRRSSATSGRCWACRRLGMVAVKGARWQGTGRGYIVSCALHRLKHALLPVVGSNAIRIFKCCCPQTPADAR